MSTHNICYQRDFRKISVLLGWKTKVPYLELGRRLDKVITGCLCRMSHNNT